MTDHRSHLPALDLPVPTGVPRRPFDDLALRSAELVGSLHRHAWNPRLTLGEAIPAAELLLSACASQSSALRHALEPMPREDLKRATIDLLTAWPNASRGDLAGYGAQLVRDVLERQPCRYAVREGFRKLRHTSRFLPAIAEVIDALDEAQSRIRDFSARLTQLPALIEDAKIRLAKQQRETAAWSARHGTACETARRESAERTPDWLR